MKFLRDLLASLVALAFLALMAWGGYLLIRYLVGEFETLPPEWASILSLVATLILLCTGILAWAIRNRKAAPVQESLLSEKARLYAHFLEQWWGENEEGISIPLHTQMLQLASDLVLREYAQLRKLSQEEETPDQALVEQSQKLLRAIRQDMGHKNLGLAEEDWQQLWGQLLAQEQIHPLS
ncbi:MAG: hypothetical protein AAFU64_16515 [Bacteroidota bacterium]